MMNAPAETMTVSAKGRELIVNLCVQTSLVPTHADAVVVMFWPLMEEPVKMPMSALMAASSAFVALR